MEHQHFMRDPILVYCHVKPVTNNASEICLNTKDENTVVLHTCKTKSVKDEYYSFAHVFDSRTTQKTLFDHIALPLIKDLLPGRNGVLFLYGVLFSEEILMRCIEVIFNSIKNFQNPENVVEKCERKEFKLYPALNISKGYSNETDHVQEIESRSQSFWDAQIQDSTTLEVCSHKNYSVLVSNVEIYDNYIYDLLKDSADRQRHSKKLQKDHTGQVYVFEAIEKEVNTAKEALSEFKRGQVHRNNLLTTLKPEFSYPSQTVFNIKVAQFQSNSKTEKISQEREKISQLSIVYLNGDKDASENAVVNQNFRKLRSTNKTVTTLQKCFKAYRNSVNNGMRKVIPYEDSKLTQLFQLYFKGYGKIRMLVSVNPNMNDYGNTVEALKFAEKIQDISSVSSSSVALSVGSKLSDQLQMKRKKYINKWEYLTPVLEEATPAFNISYSSNNLMEDEQQYNSLIDSLNIKILRHKNLARNLLDLQKSFRKNLTNVERENVNLKQENIVLQQDLKGREYQVQILEQKLLLAEQTIEKLNRHNIVFQEQTEKIKTELNYKTKRLMDQSNEIEEVKQKMQEKLAQEKNRLKKNMDKRFASKQAELKRKLCFTDEKLKQLRGILNDDLDTLESINTVCLPSVISIESSISTSTQQKRKHSVFTLLGNSIMKPKLMKFQSAPELPQERTNPMESINYNDCHSVKQSYISQSSGMCSTQAELLNKSLSCSESVSCLSRKEQQSSILRLEGKAASFYSGSSSSMRQRNNIMEEIRNKSTTPVDRIKSKQALTAKPQNISVFSIRRENFSNPDSLIETKVKEIHNLPYVYRMRSAMPKQSKFKKVFVKSFSFCAKGRAIENYRDKNCDYKGQKLWVEHKPLEVLEINAALGPEIKTKKSVWRLKTKDLTHNNVSKYLLHHQEEDSHGEIETHLYKGDIIPSASGGVQVSFTEVDKVCLVSTLNDNVLKKRNRGSLPLNEVEKRCKISLECHGKIRH